MKKLIVLSILCLAFTGCGSKETNTNNVTVETETQIESEVIETETTAESEIIDTEEIATEIQLTDEDKLIGFTAIDPIQLYVIEDNPVYGNPNEYLGFVTVNGVSVSEEPMTFTYTYEHSGYKYYGYENVDGELRIIWEGVLSETPPTENQLNGTDNTMTKEEEQQAQQEYEEVVQEMVQDQAEQTGSTYDEAYEDIFGSDDGGDDFLTADDDMVSDYEYSDERSDWMTDEILDILDGGYVN